MKEQGRNSQPPKKQRGNNFPEKEFGIMIANML